MQKCSTTRKEESSLCDLTSNHWSNLIFHIHDQSRGSEVMFVSQRSSRMDEDVHRNVRARRNLEEEMSVEGDWRKVAPCRSSSW